MSDTKKYEHISVSSARDEETVILAGKREGGDIGHSVDSASSQQETSPETRPAKTPDVEDLPVARESDSPKKSDAGYDPTTLDDIESSKMPRIQIAVIVIAVVAIVAFAIWYAFFS